MLLVRQEAVCLSGQRAFWATGMGKHDGPGEGCLSVSTPLCLCLCLCVCVCLLVFLVLNFHLVLLYIFNFLLRISIFAHTFYYSMVSSISRQGLGLLIEI